MSTTAMTPTFMSKLNSRQEVAEGTMVFRFEKPASWTFKPGRFVT
jgi:NAD(P)H-flavin reductase